MKNIFNWTSIFMLSNSLFFPIKMNTLLEYWSSFQTWRDTSTKLQRWKTVVVCWYHRHIAKLSIEEKIRTHVEEYDTRRSKFDLNIAPWYYNENSSFLQDTVSVHRPSFYASRFLKFMAENVFKKIPSRKYLVCLSVYVCQNLTFSCVL